MCISQVCLFGYKDLDLLMTRFEEIFAGIEKYSLIEIYYLHTAQSLLVIGLVSVSMSNSMAAVEAIATEKPKLGQTR